MLLKSDRTKIGKKLLLPEDVFGVWSSRSIKPSGIESVISGYTGGHKENPTYEEVCAGTTGHTEAVQITFDPAVFLYKDLVEVYWQRDRSY